MSPYYYCQPLHRTAIDSSKKRQSIHTDGGGSPGQFAVWAPPKTESHNSEAAINYEKHAASSFTFTYSSQISGQPTSSTPRSSPPFRPVDPEKEESLPQQMASFDMSSTDAERDRICSSPTWHKDTARKERRATRRLEADRKDLAERLLRLEANQARLEQGIYERNPRRLTKKQPVGSAPRSSSANTERPRSSSAFSTFFSGSRRSSRSRASSVTGNDAAPRRCSSDTPPTLSLTLPERFGAAVSRELATRDGNSLLLSHQLQRTIHTTPKSDDLRENWRMAEAWQRKYGGHEVDAERPDQKPELDTVGQPVAHDMTRKDELPRLQTTEPSADLDRELFTANLRHDRRPLGSNPTASSSVPQGNATSESSLPSSRNKTLIESHQQCIDPKPTRVTTARQLHDLAPPESMQGLAKRGRTRSLLPTFRKVTPSQQSRMGSRSQVHPKIYKSSPLALNPSTTDNPERKDEARIPAMKQGTGSETTPQPPPRLSQSYEYEEARWRNRLPVSSHPLEAEKGQLKEGAHNEQRQSVNQPLHSSSGHGTQNLENRRPMSSFNNQEQISGKIRRSPNGTHPLEHAGRSVSLANNRLQWTRNENQQSPGVAVDAPVGSSPKPVGQNDLFAEEASRSRTSLRCLNSSARSRSASRSSSQASYDTADEEVLSVPQSQRRNAQATSAEARTTVSSQPAQNVITLNKRVADSQNSSPPPLARDGSVTVLQRKPKQKVRPPLPDQLVAKVFVICCRCNYWHDMPSEVYAKLACPERLPSDSLLARTFSRRNSFSRKSSRVDSLLYSDSSEKRRLPMPRRPRSIEDETQAARESKSAAGAPLTPPSCCWCGHSMNRSCCQGWTTLVQMRQRHH